MLSVAGDPADVRRRDGRRRGSGVAAGARAVIVARSQPHRHAVVAQDGADTIANSFAGAVERFERGHPLCPGSDIARVDHRVGVVYEVKHIAVDFAETSPSVSASRTSSLIW